MRLMHDSRPIRSGLWGGLALLVLTGCASVRPDRITTDRMEYGQVIADSWKRQTLLNVVRLRYADAPVFLDVVSVINSYSVGGNASGTATLPSNTDPSVFALNAQGTWSNTPTVTYQPLLGDRFTKSLLQPVPPAAVFRLLQGGWPADLVMQTVVSSINGLRNESDGVDADASFRRLLETMTRIQRAAGLGIRMETQKDGGSVVVVLLRADADTALREDARRVRELLGLEEGIGEFDITYGLVPRSRREAAVICRSMLEIMLQLGFSIELPAAHTVDGRALPSRRQAGHERAASLLQVHSGAAEPADAYAAVKYKNYWYWINDTDIESKRIFTILMILFSLAETGQAAAGPVVTVPSR
jgi:hypothetical protein